MAPPRFPPATWSHLATTYDGSTLRLYVNGAQVSSKPVTGGIVNGSGPLHVGGNAVWAEWFSGQIDDLRVYNRALTSGELQTDMNTPVGGTPPPPADTQAPTAPAGLAASGQTQTQITLNWNASSDNVGVTGYSRYRNGTLISSGTGTSFSFTGLTCGTSYTLAVDAYDAAGNRSTRPSVSASTSACSPAPDTQAPTAPAGLAASGQTQTQITLSWNASTDNVGVTGYSRYQNGTLVSSGTGTSFNFTGLTCGTSYTLAVDAYDAAGNRSTRPLDLGFDPGLLRRHRRRSPLTPSTPPPARASPTTPAAATPARSQVQRGRAPASPAAHSPSTASTTSSRSPTRRRSTSRAQ